MKDTKKALLEAGEKLINEHGFTAAGLTKIISEAGSTKGSFYHYFKSKEHFGEILLQSYFDDHVKILESFLLKEGMTGSQKIQAYFQHWCDSKLTKTFQIDCLLVRVSSEISSQTPAMKGVMSHGLKDAASRLAFFFKECSNRQDLTTDTLEVAAQSLCSLWLGSTIMSALLGSDTPLKSAMEQTIIICDSLGLG